MLRLLLGFFVILHGLVFFWYVVLSREWVPFEPEMGWTGESWLLSRVLERDALRTLATVLYGLALLAFVIGGFGILLNAGWVRPWLTGAVIYSSLVILLYWDGNPTRIVEKGLLGLAINAALMVLVWVFVWPAGVW